jgi:ribonuclease HI
MTYNSSNYKYQIFGSQGTAFQHKWKGTSLAHAPNKETTQQIIHCARLVVQENKENITIIIFPDISWHENQTPYAPIYPNTLVIAYLQPNTLTYEMPLKPNEQYTEPLATYIICILYKDHEFISPNFKTKFQYILNIHLETYTTYTDNPNTTPTNTKVYISAQWTHTSTNIQNNIEIRLTLETPPCPLNNILPQLKFSTNNDYTDGSYIPPKPQEHKKPSDIAGYSIYKKEKNIKSTYKLLGLQNILRAELTAIYDTIKLTNANTEPTYIFTDSLNSIYLINTQLRHLTLQNNHLDKLLLQEITKYKKNKQSPLSIYKVRAHKNILGNEEADKLVKKGTELEIVSITEQYHNGHTNPYRLHRDEPYQHGHPFKDPIKNYQKYLEKRELSQQKEIAKKFPYIHKWINNVEIELDDSNYF